MFFYLICVLLFGSPYLLQLNISFKIQYFISLVLLFLYFIYEKKFILPWNKLRIFVLFFLLTAIDKLNDFFYCADLSQLISILYSFFIFVFLLGMTEDEGRMFWKIVKNVVLFSCCIATLLAIVNHTPLEDFDRDVSAALYIYFVCTFFSCKRNYLILFLVLYVEIFVFEARTLILSFIAFILSFFFFRKCTNNSWKKNALILELVALSFMIYGAITFERKAGCITPLFTGRGLLWDAGTEKILHPDSNVYFFLGIPSTSANLGKNFGGIILDPREGRGDNLLSDLEGGHFHSGFIYTLYNTGIIGCLLLLFIFFTSFSRLEYNYCNFCAFMGALIIWVLNGRSINGIYLLSTMMMLFLLVPISVNTSKK